MSIRIESTTDSPQAVTAALGGLAQKSEEVVENKSAQGQEPGETADESDASDEVSEDNAAEESGEESDEQESEEKSDKKPKQNGFKKRVDKLNKRVTAAQQEAEYWKAQALKQAKAEQEPRQNSSAQKADASSRPKADQFDTHEEYVDALAEWKVEQKLAEREEKQKEAQIKSEHQKQIQSHVERVEAFKKAHEDFDEVISDVDDIPVSVAVQELILASEIGPQLMYELAKDPEEFERINKLGPIQAAREMGKLEARLSTDSKEPKEIKKTKAPKPLSPIGAKAGTVKKSIYDENLSQAEYERLRMEQRSKRG